jgi:hypothetical protein
MLVRNKGKEIRMIWWLLVLVGLFLAFAYLLLSFNTKTAGPMASGFWFAAGSCVLCCGRKKKDFDWKSLLLEWKNILQISPILNL